jgi:hypothetical protein
MLGFCCPFFFLTGLCSLFYRGSYGHWQKGKDKAAGLREAGLDWLEGISQ